jgi:hypothetical protein
MTARGLRLSLTALVLASITALLPACNRGGDVAFDLIDQFPSAKERRPKPDSHSVVDATLRGDSRKAILFNGEGRVKYELTIPPEAFLELGVGMLEEAWKTPGDGVVIFIYVTPLDAKGQPSYTPEGGLVTDELISLTVNPYANEADRGWHPLTLDLSKYAGQRVELVFVSRSSPPANPPRSDSNGDRLVWGHPRIVVH